MTPPKSPPSGRVRAAGRRWAARLGVAYLAAALAAWAALHFGADEWAGPTLFVFGPRWVAALPLVVLVPLAALGWSWRGVVPTVLAAAVVAGPLTGGTISVTALAGSGPPAVAYLRVATWNMASHTPPTGALKVFLDEVQPDVLVCEEASLADVDLPRGWRAVGTTSNRLVTRLPARLEASMNFWDLGGGGGVDRFTLEAPDGDVTVVAVHLPTVRPGIEAALGTKFRDLGEMRRMIAMRSEASYRARAWVAQGTRGGEVIAAGDFNMPVESRVYRTDWLGLGNAYSDAGTGWGTTKQTSWFGTRIDHVLYSSPWACRRVWVGPAMGSDHRPLVAELAREGG